MTRMRDAPAPLLWGAELTPRFEAFVASQRQGDAQDIHNIELKRTHSWRVMENAVAIAQSLSLPEGPFALCRAAGLLHDFGRFPQYRQYKTFHDGKSENHAKLGVRHLRREAVCREFPPAARRLVQSAVMLHNRRTLPQGIAPLLRSLAEVVRDADKVDIIRIMAGHFTTPDAVNPVVTLHVKEDPKEFTQAMLDEVLRGETGDYRKMQWSNDFKILLCGWVGQLAYAHSRTLIAQQGNLEKIMETLPAAPGMDTLKAWVREQLATPLHEPASVGELQAWRPQEGQV